MIVKCQWCEKKDTDRKEMEFELVANGKTRKYYHKHCWEEHLKKKAIIEKEMPLKDELNATLMKIFGAKEIPSPAWVMLERLRGGNPVFKKQVVGKRYREGYEYPLIKETFEYCSDTIEYYLATKGFKGFMDAFNYCLAIIIDKIYYVEQRVKEREHKQALIKGFVESANYSDQDEFESNYKKPTKAENDISDFLD